MPLPRNLSTPPPTLGILTEQVACSFETDPRTVNGVDDLVWYEYRTRGLSLMGKELPILPSTAQPSDTPEAEAYQYSRVFCQKDNAPPLRLLLEFLTSRGQAAITPPDMDDTILDEWAWVQITLGYERARKPIQVVCVRDRGSYQDEFNKEKGQFIHLLSNHDDIEAGLVREYVERARFVLTTRFALTDMTDAGYDFNGWILEFYQDQCNGIVQIDNQGFYSPKGDLILDLSFSPE